MLRQTRRISHIRIGGRDQGAAAGGPHDQKQQPLLNQKLRRNRQLCSSCGGCRRRAPQVVYAHEVNFATEPHLYGLCASRHAALDGLRALADAQRLCNGALGLEQLTPASPAFGRW